MTETEVVLYKPQQAALDKALAVIEPGVEKLKSEVDGVTVTPDTFDDVSALYARIRRGLKSVEDGRKAMTAKLNAQKRAIDGAFRPHREALEELSETVSGVLGEYNRLAREAQARAAAAARAAWDTGKPLEEVAADGDSAPIQVGDELLTGDAARDYRAAVAKANEPSLLDVQTAPVRQQPVLGAVKRSRTPDSTVTMSTVWEFEVTDADSVPREYLRIDMQAIGAAVKGGVREVPGVRIYSVEKPRARSR